MRVLLCDDDRDLVDLLRYAFRRDGYTVSVAFDGEMGLRIFDAEAPDLVVIDLMMPKRGGIQVLKEIRRRSKVPVLILTAVGDEDQLVSALDLGADDYLTKPFRPRELRARVHDLERRSKQQGEPAAAPARPITLGRLTIDPRTRIVTRDEKPVELTAKEFALLHYLMLNRDIVLSVSDIFTNVWGFDSSENEDVVKVTIYRLRRKVEQDPSSPQHILNLPGQGYKFQYKSDNP
jgi:two-component system response regulator VicR